MIKNSIIESIDNVYLNETNSEFDILRMISEYYTKSIDILENYDGDDVSSFGVFQESYFMEADKPKETTFRKIDKKTGKMESMFISIAKFIPRLLKACINALKKLFGKGKEMPKTKGQIAKSKFNTFLNAVKSGDRKAITGLVAVPSTIALAIVGGKKIKAHFNKGDNNTGNNESDSKTQSVNMEFIFDEESKDVIMKNYDVVAYITSLDFLISAFEYYNNHYFVMVPASEEQGKTYDDNKKKFSQAKKDVTIQNTYTYSLDEFIKILDSAKNKNSSLMSLLDKLIIKAETEIKEIEKKAEDEINEEKESPFADDSKKNIEKDKNDKIKKIREIQEMLMAYTKWITTNATTIKELCDKVEKFVGLFNEIAESSVQEIKDDNGSVTGYKNPENELMIKISAYIPAKSDFKKFKNIINDDDGDEIDNAGKWSSGMISWLFDRSNYIENKDITVSELKEHLKNTFKVFDMIYSHSMYVLEKIKKYNDNHDGELLSLPDIFDKLIENEFVWKNIVGDIKKVYENDKTDEKLKKSLEPIMKKISEIEDNYEKYRKTKNQ